MWPFRQRYQAHTYFYDPDIGAIRDPAVREWVSRVLGLITQLDGRVAYVENNLSEIRERLTWTTQLDGSPFTEGDRIARGIAGGEKAPPEGV
jgi:hypothetical protein